MAVLQTLKEEKEDLQQKMRAQLDKAERNQVRGVCVCVCVCVYVCVCVWLFVVVCGCLWLFVVVCGCL